MNVPYVFSGPLLDELAEQVVVRVAVRALRPGSVEKGGVGDRSELDLPGLGALHIPDAAGHVEQFHRGDMGPLAGQLERFLVVQIITDRGVEVERVGRALALLIEEQDAEGGERLRHRTDVEPGVSLDGRAGRRVREPVSLRQGDLPVGDDRHGDAGELVLSEVGLKGLRNAVGQFGLRGRA